MAGLLIKKINKALGSKAPTSAVTAIVCLALASVQTLISGLWMMGFRRMGFY